MSVDLRRFTYALEPLRSQRKWQLEALLTRLGRAQAAVQQAEEDLAILRERHRSMSLEMAEALVRGVNPAQYILGLQWLAHLKSQILDQKQTLESLHTERAEIRAQCQAHHHKVEVLDEHRADCVLVFAQEEAGRQALEADRDWIARLRLTRNKSLSRVNNRVVTSNFKMPEGRIA